MTQFAPYLGPWFFTLELVFFIFVELFHRQAIERTRVSMASETEAAAGNTTINP